MKKVFITILMFLPLTMSAQSVLTPEQKLEQAQKQLEEAKKAVEEAKAAAKAAKSDAELKPSIANEPTTLPAKGGKPVVVDVPAEKNASTSKQGWVVPKQEKVVETKKVVKNAKGQSVKKDPKYLENAITTDADGKVQFVLNTDCGGKSADQIYDIVYQYMNGLAQEKNNIASRVALVNKDEHVIACKMDEWIVFSNSFLSLDRSEVKYQLVAKIADNSLQLTINRIYYLYEQDRSTGFTEPAENVITDEMALNKKKTDLSRIYGKFRKGTIDRKDQIFSEITALVKQ